MARDGACVAVADRCEEHASETVAPINAAGCQAIAIGGGGENQDVAAMVSCAAAALGRTGCTVVVETGKRRLHEMPRASFDGMLALNLIGVFLCMKHEIARMPAQGGEPGGGAIVNIASIARMIGPRA